MPNSQVVASLEASAAGTNTANSGPISLGLPLIGASSGGSPQSAATATPAPAKTAVRIWIGTLKSDYEARIYWAQQVQRFPDLLKRLTLDLRPVDLGSGHGIWFKVMGGPLAGAEAAERICRAIKSRSPADECTVTAD
jgi:hypothetical protein